MVKAARGLSIGTIMGFQAGIFLGKQAVDVGLADDCMSWEDCLAYIKTATNRSRVAKSQSSVFSKCAKLCHCPRRAPMLKLTRDWPSSGRSGD